MFKKRQSYFLSLLWMVLMANNAIGQPIAGFSVYEDISHQWLIYDYAEKMYVPYLPGVHPPTRYLHVAFHLAAWEPAQKLIIPVENETLLFIDNSLSHHIKQKQTLVWDLDSLSATAPISLITCVFVRPIEKTPPLFLGRQQSITLDLTVNNKGDAPTVQTANRMNAQQSTIPRRPMEQKNYLMMAAIVCSIMLASFSLINPRYVSIKDSLQMLLQLFKYREVQEKADLNSLFVFGIMFATLVAYLLMLVAGYSVSLAHLTDITSGGKLFMSSYLKIAGWLFAFLLFKYLLIELLNGIFAHRSLAEKHMAISFHVHKIFLLTIFALFLAYHMSHYHHMYISSKVLYYMLIWGWIAATAISCLILYLSVTQRFVYLIVYLCTAEVLPLLLVLKLFLIPS